MHKRELHGPQQWIDSYTAIAYHSPLTLSAQSNLVFLSNHLTLVLLLLLSLLS
jgi:hypothetical protein